MKTVWCVVKIDTFGGGSDPVFFDKKNVHGIISEKKLKS